MGIMLFESATWGIYKFQLPRRRRESEKMSCHAILKNLYEPKMDVILTISFKITAKIEITKRYFFRPTWQTRTYQRFVKHNYVLSFIHCHGMRLHRIFLLSIARLMRLDHL